MGSEQSTVVSGSEKAVAYRPQAREAPASPRNQQSFEDDYVHVDVNEKDHPKYTRRASSLSVSAVERWEETLLQDPKNK